MKIAGATVLALLLSYTSGGSPPSTFTSVAMSNVTFTAGTASTVGTATAVISSGPNTPTWSFKTSGVDSASGAPCNDYGANFSLGNSSTAPSGSALTTTDGTWTWGGANGGRPGEYNVLLNGSQAGIGILMQVFAGHLYVNTLNQGWYSYNNGFTNSNAPGPDPTGAVTVSASTPVGSYPGTCLQAAQAGVGGSPYSKAFTLVGSGGTQTIASIAPNACSFTAGTQNGVICDLTVAMSPTSPGSTAALTLSGANSGAFHLVGAGCANISAGICTIEQSAAGGGTPAAVYTDVNAVATQAGASNSPVTQALTLTGNSSAPTIASIGATNTFFTAQAGNANSTIGTLSAMVTSGAFSGTLILATSGGCTGTDNASFAITGGTTLKIGTSDVTGVRNYDVCVKGTDAAFANSPKFQTLTLTGTGVGAVVTTDTFTNYSGSTLLAGTPITFGKGFRYGDIMPGTHPVIRDASTHVALAGQQWDEIATWCQHIPGGSCTTGATGFNGSWRHAVWGAWLPANLANGASFQVEYVATAGSYSESSHQALSVLCSGGAAHDLKIHLSDVRNQNDTVRDSGDATFRLCDNIASVGRDAPRHIRAGNVYDEYVVSGLFIYATTGHADPALYGQCIVDIFTKASDGTSPGDVRSVCLPSNSWMNVAAGTAGNSGNIGPAGLAGDPQSISYRPEILDGAASVLNWSGLDATISSASNPIQPAGSVGCYTGYGDNYCMNVPTANGVNSWYAGMAVRPTCSATCPAGMVNNQLYYAAPVGEVGTNGFSSTEYALVLGADMTYAPLRFMTAAQGSGSTTFNFRVMHYHWNTIPLLDQTGLPNWSPFGTTTRVVRKIYPNFTAAEKLYWEQTGLVIPLNLSQTINPSTPSPNNHMSPYYTPNGTGVVIGGSGTGPRPDLGIISRWAVQAFIVGGEVNWDYARLFTLGSPTHGTATILNEATGRIPVMNNGPPTGAGGNGAGGSYAGLGAPHNQTAFSGFGPQDMVDINNTIPSAATPAAYGQFGTGTYLSHMPSFDSLTYMIFGDRHWLDLMRFQGNRAYSIQRTGPGPELGQGYLRDNNAKFTDGNTYHYYGILYDCCQGRGYAWMMRDIINPAAFGDDNDIERAYFDDFLVESRNYYPMWLRFKDGPSQSAPNNTNYSTSIVEPGGTGGEGVTAEPFIQTYVFDAEWDMLAFLHEPLASTWMKQEQRYVEGNCGHRLAGAMPYYCFDYYYSYAITNGADGSVTSQQGSTGLYTNGMDASDFGIVPTINLLTGGQWFLRSYVATTGDQAMLMSNYHIFGPAPPIDQLPGNRYFSVINPAVGSDANGQFTTFYLQCTSGDHTAFPTQCPTAGQAFTGYTSSGSTTTNTNAYTLKLRLAYDNPANTGVGYSSINYMDYGGQRINGLHIAGYNVANAMSDWVTRGGGYNPSTPENNWDPSVVVPGLPVAVNSIP